MIDVSKVIEIIKKQGATGVLAMWLWYTHSDVQDLKHRLYECYGKNNNTASKPINDTTHFAIVPKDELIEIE
jgi:hypothetical protein